MKIFNKYSWPDLLDRKITFSFKTNIKKWVIEKYLNDYFDLWDNNHFSLEFTDFIKPSIQLDKFANILYKKIEEKWDRFRYNIDLYSELDEISLITYIYINWYISIKNDSVNHMWWKDLFFIVNTNETISKFLNKYVDKVTILDHIYYFKSKKHLINGDDLIQLEWKDTHLLLIVLLENFWNNNNVPYIEKSLKKIWLDLKTKLKWSSRTFTYELIDNIITNWKKESSKLKWIYNKIIKEWSNYQIKFD